MAYRPWSKYTHDFSLLDIFGLKENVFSGVIVVAIIFHMDMEDLCAALRNFLA